MFIHAANKDCQPTIKPLIDAVPLEKTLCSQLFPGTSGLYLTLMHREINRLINRLLLVLKRNSLGVHLVSKEYLKGCSIAGFYFRRPGNLSIYQW